jgi:DNA-binding NarL/FixJ family response regulator
MSTILIADDHPLFREALEGSIKPFFEDLHILQADSVPNTLKALKAHPEIDLVLLDLNMPGSDNFYGLTSVLEGAPNIPVVVISSNETDQAVNVAMHFGAKGYIPKSFNSRKIAHGIMSVLQGGSFIPEKFIEAVDEQTPEFLTSIQRVKELTPKQLRVLECLKEGLSNREIADKLFVTEATIKAHVSAIFKKFNVTSRTQVVLLVEQIDSNEF